MRRNDFLNLRWLAAIGIIGLILVCSLYAKRELFCIKDEFGAEKTNIENLEINGLRNGDLIFQTSLSGQSKAIQLATKSRYSHCGIIYKERNDYFVLEAVQPVKLTSLNTWIARGQDGKFVIKRLKNADRILTPTAIAEMKKLGKKYLGKSYDLTFEWSDDKMYCSELIWKIYKQSTGLEIGELQKLKDFDLTNKIVKEKMHERYRDNIPEDEIVISPAAIFESELLFTVTPSESNKF